MPTSTSSYALQKPSIGGDADLWGTYLNTSLDIADQEIYAGRVLTDTAVSASTATVPFSLPAGVKQIRMLLSGVSSNGTSNWLVQFNAGAGYVVTGYTGSGSKITAANTCSIATETAGFSIMPSGIVAANTFTGTLDLSLVGGTGLWVAKGVFARSDGAVSQVAGTIDLGAGATAIRLHTANGTDTFDAGTVNIHYEYGSAPTYGV